MSKTKKRPSKKAKAAKKILENSKLLEKSGESNNPQDEELFKQPDSSIKTSTAFKARPPKKRA
jgi:hypothetical protein